MMKGSRDVGASFSGKLSLMVIGSWDRWGVKEVRAIVQ